MLNLHPKVRAAALLVCVSLAAAFVGGNLPDADHIPAIMGWLSEGRPLHPYHVLAGSFLAAFGSGFILTSLCRFYRDGVLK